MHTKSAISSSGIFIFPHSFCFSNFAIVEREIIREREQSRRVKELILKMTQRRAIKLLGAIEKV